MNGFQLANTILAFAGKDVSHWFNGDEWIQYTHPITGMIGPYYRFGPGPQQPAVPSPKWRPLTKCPWWLDESIIVGKATAKTRPIRITNAVTGKIWFTILSLECHELCFKTAFVTQIKINLKKIFPLKSLKPIRQ